MKKTCDYCGNLIDDTQERCPSCGAPNPGYTRQSVGTPRTIEQLQQWYQDRGLPSADVTRFFIGRDYKGPRAFGIYRDGDRVIVYKNKSDGTRAIRYNGADEAYAVNEIYQKLKEEVAKRNGTKPSSPVSSPITPKSAGMDAVGCIHTVLTIFTVIVICGALILGLLSVLSTLFDGRPDQGYYRYKDETYYYLSNSWYSYDDDKSEWVYAYPDQDFQDNADDYFQSYSFESSYGTSDFEDTSYYSSWEASKEDDRYDSDWDSDYDWDSDSDWDYGDTDWDSDW